jgi:hypothetical protein
MKKLPKVSQVQEAHTPGFQLPLDFSAAAKKAAAQEEDRKRVHLRIALAEAFIQNSAAARAKGAADSSMDYSLFNRLGMIALYHDRDTRGLAKHKKLPKPIPARRRKHDPRFPKPMPGKNQARPMRDHVDEDEYWNYASSAELEINLRRLTETRDELGKLPLEAQTRGAVRATHEEVGARLRGEFKKKHGLYPEDMPLADSARTAFRRLPREEQRQIMHDVKVKRAERHAIRQHRKEIRERALKRRSFSHPANASPRFPR